MHRYEFGTKYDVLIFNTEQLFFKIVGTSGEQSIYLKLLSIEDNTQETMEQDIHVHVQVDSN